MASGVKIDAACKREYDAMHNKKEHTFIIFRISDDDTTIVVEKTGSKGASYGDFVDALQEALGTGGKECRYAVVDVEFNIQRQGTGANSVLKKLVFVQYCPDDAPVRKRMLYASSVRGLKTSLGLEHLVQLQASEMSDLDEKALKSELMSSQRL